MNEKLKMWAKKIDRAREDEESWTSTFREYQERELAAELLENDRVDAVLIDGPILTQNLLSQAEGRKLLKRLIASSRAIGYIKDLSANALLKAIGFALKTGETFTIHDWKRMLSDRFQTGQRSIASGWRTTAGRSSGSSTNGAARRTASSAARTKSGWRSASSSTTASGRPTTTSH